MTKDELVALKVDESLHGDATLAEIKDIPTALKVLVDTKAMVGASIRIPSDKASAEEVTAFRAKLKERVPELIELPADAKALEAVEESIFERLGKPKDVKGYPTLKDAGVAIPEGVEVNEEELRTYAAKLGFTKKQYAKLATEVVGERTKAVQLTSEARKALKVELGDAFDERLTAAAAAAKKLGASDATVQALRTGAVPVEQAKVWINVAKSLGTEAGELGLGSGSGTPRITPAEARAQIDEMYRNPALKDKAHPRHNDLVTELHRLTGIGYPD